MSQNYTVIARKYRPQSFADVLGQDPIVATLKNGIRQNRLAHAYLFSGPRGTGKTTLARLLAKAINCRAPTDELEPCNECTSCKGITAGSSLDVLEIDGASHRGIDDIRQINETVSFAPASGKYKIYIIDEVHMLTKEAFNALLKTLEEPPEAVKFFFATTEPHKVLPTILSRCQHFALRRLPPEVIIQKLQGIAKDLGRNVDIEALSLVAKRAEGGLRDAESLFDQLLSLVLEDIDGKAAAASLGLIAADAFKTLDQAISTRNFSYAFDLAAVVFDEGKDLSAFLSDLTAHFRNHLVAILRGKNGSFYTKEQLLSLLDECINSETAIKNATSPRVCLEALLLRLIRSRQEQPLEELVKRLLELEERVGKAEGEKRFTTEHTEITEEATHREEKRQEEQRKEEKQQEEKTEVRSQKTEKRQEEQLQEVKRQEVEQQEEKMEVVPHSALNTQHSALSPPHSALSTQHSALSSPHSSLSIQHSSFRHDTLLQFAAVHLEAKVIRK